MGKFNYTKALKFPQYIQKITKHYSFYRPIRMMTILVFMMVEIVVLFMMTMLSNLIPGFSVAPPIQYLILPLVVTIGLMSLKTEGKPIYLYFWDLLTFYGRFGLRHSKRTITNERVYLYEQKKIFKPLD